MDVRVHGVHNRLSWGRGSTCTGVHRRGKGLRGATRCMGVLASARAGAGEQANTSERVGCWECADLQACACMHAGDVRGARHKSACGDGSRSYRADGHAQVEARGRY
ncbi:hypothetical protein CRG98_021183 [Punica granatum]|uniref:Uncharacterized protein n=1 Tax=Punica granatum TaxID=22663 RepID=A0A2I0JQ56_PUNGR|nr:hypothetical protein CRG98_021183 [Punica granatum]